MTTTTQEARWLRQELAGRERGRGKRYGRELRERVAAFARHRRSEGRSWAAIATELGVPLKTVSRWCEPSPAAPSSALALRAVEVVPSHIASSLAITTRSGLRVEDATLEEVIAILRSVG